MAAEGEDAERMSRSTIIQLCSAVSELKGSAMVKMALLCVSMSTIIISVYSANKRVFSFEWLGNS